MEKAKQVIHGSMEKPQGVLLQDNLGFFVNLATENRTYAVGMVVETTEIPRNNSGELDFEKFTALERKAKRMNKKTHHGVRKGF